MENRFKPGDIVQHFKREMLDTEGPFLLQCAVKEEDNVLPMTPPGSNVDEMLLEIV